MSLHKLTAGDGYTYLTRQVAAQDATHRGYDGLGDYYSQRGESPGQWMGRGAVGLPGFPESPQVSEAQMVALFGEGRHPDAVLLEEQLLAAGHDVPAVLAATRLGSPYKVHSGVNAFRRQLAIAFEGWNAAAGLPRDWPVPETERARLRTQLGRQMFTTEFGRPPADARELSGFIARASRQQTTAVAGYDATFTPVKSVSTLWAIAPPAQARAIETAHDAAVADTLVWLEEHATFTRLGRNGVRQVEVRGLIAAAFVHRDSRAGDPNLHTHVAVSNKVQVAGGPQAGQWMALDGRPIHKLAVAASERYNTRLEALLIDSLGVSFAERLGDEPGKRPVREIVGVDPALARTWSARRASINLARAQLAVTFQAEHARAPGPIEALKLAQQATLATRQAKHEPRTLAEQRTLWREQALIVLGGHDRLQAMLALVGRAPLGRRQQHGNGAGSARPTPTWVADTAETVLAVVQSSRATWQHAHVRAETERQVRTAQLAAGQIDAAVERVVAAVLSPAHSLALGAAEPVSEPALLRRTDGSSMYASAGMQLFTSPTVVAAEQALIAHAQQTGGRRLTRADLDAALDHAAASGTPLNPGQAALVRELATSGRPLQLALAPAGTGKTTAMRALAHAWTASSGTILGLAPSAAAAAVLAAELSSHQPDAGGEAAAPAGGGAPATTDTLAKLLWSLDTLQDPDAAGLEPGATRPAGRGSVPDWVHRIGPDTLVILDEAGMAGTPELARMVGFVTGRGGSVRLVGDDCQLAAIGAGGILRDLAETAGAVTLSQVVRFTDPAEGAASLALRAGDRTALGFYLDHGRVHVGDSDTTTDQAYTAWQADRAAGRDALMLAPTRQIAAGLNMRARLDRLATAATTTDPAATSSRTADPASVGRELALADGSAASAGDTIITRRNDRRLPISSTDWVKNGDRWTVDAVLDSGALAVTHLATRRRLLLPADYAAEHVALGYASTIHAAQGSTADVSHTVASGAENRQLLYVALTRGRTANHLYLQTALDGDEHSVITPDALLPPTAVDLLDRILARNGAQSSASTAQRHLLEPAERVADAADRYYDALTLAAETHLGPERLTALDSAAEQARAGLSSAPAWPALRAHLALLAVDGHDPADTLRAAIAGGELDSAADPAAVLDWRLQPTGAPAADGPLPWLPAVPAALATDPAWAHYLLGRAQHTRDLADAVAEQTRRWTPTSVPGWAAALLPASPGQDDRRDALLGELHVWRAAHQIPDADRRPTGPPQLRAAEARQQRRLDQHVTRVLGDPASQLARWRPLAEQIEPRLLTDPFWPQLTGRLAAAQRAGIDIASLAHFVTDGAADRGPLPDELPAAALWWRLTRQLSPAALEVHPSPAPPGPDPDARPVSSLRPAWTPVLTELFAATAARRVLADPAWPALVAAVTDATAAGWTPEQVLHAAHQLLRPHLAPTSDLGDQSGRGPEENDSELLQPGELAGALVWQVAMLARPEPVQPADTYLSGKHTVTAPPDPADEDREPPADLYAEHTPDLPPFLPSPAQDDAADPDWHLQPEPLPEPPVEATVTGPGIDGAPGLDGTTPQQAGPVLADPLGVAADRDQSPAATDPLPPALAGEVANGGVEAASATRLYELNAQARDFFAARYPNSWAADHLRERLGTDLTDHDQFIPGYAPAGWTALTDHLRSLGATDHELLAAGLANTARNGRLIDRFRDRLVLPILSTDQQVIGFIARRNPALSEADASAGRAEPKYLNTGDTPVFSKGAQLFGMAEGAAELAAGATPVLVEGPLDAIAVTQATGGSHIGLAPLGTAFTDTQADALRPYLGAGKPGVVVATDADAAGQKAAVRAFWQLTTRGGNPNHLVMPDGHDPASLLQTAGPQALVDALAAPPTLARSLIRERVDRFAHRMRDVEGPVLAVRCAAEAIGALAPEHWLEHIDYLTTLVPTAPGEAHLAVLDAGHAWLADPAAYARQHSGGGPTPSVPRNPSDPSSRSRDKEQFPTPSPSPKPACPPDKQLQMGIGIDEGKPLLSEPAAAVDADASPPDRIRIAELWAANAWRDVGRSIDPRLTAGSDWPGLAAALDRAARAGYDVQQHLPRLAASGRLPETRPARALHYRLVEECAAAITPQPPAAARTDEQARTAAATARLQTENDRRDNRRPPTPAQDAPGQALPRTDGRKPSTLPPGTPDITAPVPTRTPRRQR